MFSDYFMQVHINALFKYSSLPKNDLNICPISYFVIQNILSEKQLHAAILIIRMILKSAYNQCHSAHTICLKIQSDVIVNNTYFT